MTESTNSSSDPHRLPCRGCTQSCENYKQCEGKPWRQAQPTNSINCTGEFHAQS